MTASGMKIAAACMLVLCVRLAAQHHPDLGALSDYPQSSEVWLGSIVAEVSVDPEVPVEVSLQGVVSWQVPDGEPVEENQVIGLANTDKLNFQLRELDLKKNRYRNSVIDIELATAEKKRTLENSVREMEESLQNMSLTDLERQLLGADFEKRLAKERAEITADIRRSREKLESDYFQQALAAELKTLDLDIERAEIDYQELLRNSEILAPTSGKLIIEVRDVVRKLTRVARIIKQGQAEAFLETGDTRLRNIPREELVIEIDGDDGRKYQGQYSRTLQETTRDTNDKILVFTIRSPVAGEDVPSSLSGKRMIRVSRRLAQSGHIVPKAALLAKFPNEINSLGWAGFIEKRWPGARVTYVAPRIIVVNSANEN